jgi:hypothetical protein
MLRSSHFASGHFRAATLHGVPQENSSVIEGSGGGGARGSAKDRWRINIADVEYSTYEEDWLKPQEAESQPEPVEIEAVEPLEQAPEPSRKWDGLDEQALASLNIAVARNADVIQASRALEQAKIAANAAQNVAKIERLQAALTKARQDAIDAELAAIRRAEMARRDDEEAIFALMLLH